MSLSRALGLYIHWPYCARICPYCDFNVYRPKGAEDALLEAILDDMRGWRERTGARRLTSLHFGGGTPSLLSVSALQRLIDAAGRVWGFVDNPEIGLEANPNDSVVFVDYASVGINRLSVGVQSFDSGALERLGRDHSAAEAVAAVELAQRAVDQVSLDLIYAWHGQSLEYWQGELRQAVELGVGHVSPYQLTIESGTAFGKRAERGDRLALEPDDAADFYSATDEVLGQAGFQRYEISNHARNEAAQSTHNRLYWEGGDWIGIGPGAHGRLGAHSQSGRIATEAARRPGDYIDQVATTGWGVRSLETLSADDERTERVLMGMRLAAGLDLAQVADFTGLGIDEAECRRMAELGYVERDQTRLKLTREGQLLGDGVSMALIP
ncbi:MAG: radical SAM family heme chaperone HemW [Maricaulis sp.]|uniref:radical SAM family heme chaperone HemW n=1 Tax=Maricaulis sp. TaxID=1486257 RepID=UPI001B1EE5A0|nr:radical SAM family heme chaperone HemW [Maricaulis sp.]MBO6729625.1 radical SAM family heme chaperone HemW [Maricaulis sp.]MBO6846196.1 radical SAM family heme chaperone HemW [Maricaulis sp.]MBO6875927.1 radical SAM family heme chaperone HemW [Maricaulis sp.]MDM7984962.1 radical SAM family heme chaperone HemW [Maricaulis sp.]